MSEDLKDNLSNGDNWLRALLVVLFALVFCVAAWVLAFVAGLNLIILLVTGRGNGNLSQFGGQLGRYLKDIIDYGTLNSDEQPFPFGDWPEEKQAAPEPPPRAPAGGASESSPRPAKKKSSARKKTAKKKVSKKSG